MYKYKFECFAVNAPENHSESIKSFESLVSCFGNEITEFLDNLIIGERTVIPASLDGNDPNFYYYITKEEI